jgi:hypothetical protein
MATSYGPQVTQMNEKSAPESSLDLMLTQNPHGSIIDEQNTLVHCLKACIVWWTLEITISMNSEDVVRR